VTYTREMIAAAIEDLASTNFKKRRKAARRLYEAGQELSSAVELAWELGSKDFESLVLVPDDDSEFASKETVGVAVSPETFRRIHEANASPPLSDVPPDLDAMEFELHFSDDRNQPVEDRIPPSRLDILTTKDPAGSGAIAKFLAKSGEEIQQVEYEVKDVDRATRILVEKFGLKPVYSATRPGANGTRVNFFLITNPAGQKVLIELVEPAKPR
jgi:hypothetical protein